MAPGKDRPSHPLEITPQILSITRRLGDIPQVLETQPTPSGPAKRTREDELHDLELKKARLEVEQHRRAILWEEERQRKSIILEERQRKAIAF
jgi:hypothetical protein